MLMKGQLSTITHNLKFSFSSKRLFPTDWLLNKNLKLEYTIFISTKHCFICWGAAQTPPVVMQTVMQTAPPRVVHNYVWQVRHSYFNPCRLVLMMVTESPFSS